MIRKKIIPRLSEDAPPCLDLVSLASFEVTSEAEAHPLELALRINEERWEAAEPGPQTIRLLFDAPQIITRICLLFEEHETARTQEFSLRWQSASDRNWRELRRQQYNFSPPHTVSEREDFVVALPAISGLTLTIIPALHGPGTASLTHFWVV
ncbi:hypothetical protein BH09VER1_BH09VER1_49220 [soil metagenome]